MNKNLNDVCIKGDKTIRNAIKKLNKSGKKFLIVVDGNKHLIGTVTDGDIRRSFLKNTNLDETILSITNKKPVFVYKNYKKNDVLDIFNKKKITHIPVTSLKKEVVDVLDINNFNIHSLKNTKIFILAGGMGKRLYPLTKNVPKPMVNLKKKNISILENLIRNFQNHGFYDFYISVNYLKEKITSLEKFLNYKITYITEKNKLGTAGSLFLLKKHIKKHENVIVINGDVIVDLNFIDLIKFHEENKCDVTVVCKKNYTKNRLRFSKN